MRRWIVVCGFIAGLGCNVSKQPKPDPFGYRQLTKDAGHTGTPSLSRDGKFVVYTSDRASVGNLDIWVQAIEGGTSVRVTNDPATDYDPVFSADGKTVYFTSLREPQGIYSVPASGGDAEMVVPGGVSPEVSPDGTTLLFSDRSGQLATLGIADHVKRVLLEGFVNSYAGKWSPDGQEILFTGKAAEGDDLEWWVVKAAGGAPVNTGILSALRQGGLAEAYFQAWLPGDEIVFDAKRGDRLTLWRSKLSPERHSLASQPVRATDSDSGDFRAAYGAGHLVFARSKGTLNLWSLPVDLNQARATGEPERLTFTDAQKGGASMPADGQKLLYSADQGGTFRLFLKDLASGKESTVGPSTNSFYGVLSADGSQYVYGAGQPGAIDVSQRAVRGWRSWFSRDVCQRCGMPRSISRDGKSLLVWTDTEPGNHVDLVDLASGKSRRILESLSQHFYGPELAPQGNWISFVTKTGAHGFRTYVARVPAEGTVPESEWVAVTPSSDQFQMAFWSPDESVLFLLTQHGESNLNWLDAQRLDPATKHPAGEPVNVYHFKEPRVPTMDPIWNRPVAAGGRIVLELADLSTNVWIMNAPGAP
ncbi:MAG TPA: hypothetical protein VEU96_28800 [Bryobacteraceae bacterium]|nr:hypothetical protein [Bryobacteraceae bacterium]